MADQIKLQFFVGRTVMAVKALLLLDNFSVAVMMAAFHRRKFQFTNVMKMRFAKFLVLLLLAFGISRGAAADFTLSSSPASGSGPYFVNTGDVNFDGKPDLVIADSGSSGITVYTNKGNGTFAAPNPSFHTVGPNPECVAVLNGVGPVLVVAANSGTNTVTVFSSTGNGILTSNAAVVVGSHPTSLAGFDFINFGDGFVDLICLNSGSSSITLLQNQWPSSTLAVQSTINLGTAPQFMTSGNIDGINLTDLVVQASASSIVLTNKFGTPWFTSNQTLNASISGGTVPVLADVNNDGKSDLIVSESSGALVIFTNIGSGKFSSSPLTNLDVSPEASWAAAGDINGDGSQDLVASSFNGQYVIVYTNNGSGGFAMSSTISGGFPFFVTLTDVNGDGKPDLIDSDLTNSKINVYFNTAVWPAPIIHVPADITAEATKTSGAVVSFSTSATNYDNVTLTTTNSPASGSTFPLGTNIVTVIANNVGTLATNFFNVIVQDTTPPIIHLLGANLVTNYVNYVYTDAGVTATDIYSGNLTSSIQVSSDVNTNAPGIYNVNYFVSDSSGNSASTNRTVVILPVPLLATTSANGQVYVMYGNAPGSYVIQSTTNLTSPDWQTVTGATPVVGFTLPTSNQPPNVFFRILPQ